LGIIASKFKNVEIIEHFNNFYKLRIAKEGFSIGYIFGFMESMKEKYNIEEYAVSQTSLEQIFNAFANEDERTIGSTYRQYFLTFGK